jgi:hypothetical protein
MPAWLASTYLVRSARAVQRPVPPNPTAGILTALALGLAIVAIFRSPRKFQTAAYIIGAEVICAVLGATVGFAVGTPAFAGTVAGVSMQVGGIAASLERIWRYRKGA